MTRKRRKLTPTEIAQRAQIREARNVLKNIGFTRMPRIDGKHFEYLDRKTEMDDIHFFENVMLIVEYTIGDPGTHLLKKKIFYDKVMKDNAHFIRYINNNEQFIRFNEVYNAKIKPKYSYNEIIIRVLYCSRQTINIAHKKLVNIHYFDYHIVKYFENLAKIIKKSSRHEFF